MAAIGGIRYFSDGANLGGSSRTSCVVGLRDEASHSHTTSTSHCGKFWSVSLLPLGRERDFVAAAVETPPKDDSQEDYDSCSDCSSSSSNTSRDIVHSLHSPSRSNDGDTNIIAARTTKSDFNTKSINDDERQPSNAVDGDDTNNNKIEHLKTTEFDHVLVCRCRF